MAVLLEKRMNLVNKVIAYKKAADQAVLDTNREQAVLSKVAQQVQHKEFETTILETFSDIMKNSRQYQEKQLQNENRRGD